MIDPDNLPPAAEPLRKVLPAGEPLQRAPFKPCEFCPSATACERWGYCNAEAARGEHEPR